MRKLIIIFCIIIFAASCSLEEKKTVTADGKEYPDQESWNAVILITNNGRTVGHLKAGHVQKFTRKKVTYLDEKLQVDFYNEQGRHTSVLTSEAGKVFDAKQDMEAYGNVVVVSDSGLTLFTDTLKWNNKEQKIYSEIPVKFASEENDTLYGDSFKSDPDLVNYEIENPRGKSKKTLSIE